MTVSLTVMKTISGVAAADSLRGGTSGYDFGEAETGATAPNKTFYLKHDGTAYITNLAVNVQAYSGTYGGDYSASSDLAKLVTHGDALSGLQCDFRWNAATPFNSTHTTFKTNTGVSFATRITVPTTAMSLNSTSEVAASVPVAGRIGATADATLGDRAHMTMRYMNPSGESQNGTRQFDIYFSYNFTS